MNLMYLLLSLLGGSTSNVIDRLNLKRNRASVRQVLFLIFLGMSLWTGLFILLTNLPFPKFEAISLLLMGLMILFSFSGNICDMLSLKADDLSLREPLIDFYPILAGLFGYVLFPSERKSVYLWAFLFGTLIVHWGMHRIKLGRLQRQGIGYLALSVIFFATLPSIEKELIRYMHPAYITLFRTSSILILTMIFMPIKNLRGFTPKRVGYGALSGIACTIAAIAGLYALQAYGVVVTMLFTMLAPATRYLAGQFILKEKVRKVEVVSSLLLTLVVAITAFAT